eukprot:UN10904
MDQTPSGNCRKPEPAFLIRSPQPHLDPEGLQAQFSALPDKMHDDRLTWCGCLSTHNLTREVHSWLGNRLGNLELCRLPSKALLRVS